METRELSQDEILLLMSLEGSEGWMCLTPNQEEIEEIKIPDKPASVEGKSESELLMKAIYAYWKQSCTDGKYAGIFDVFYKEKMAKLRGIITSNLHD